MGSLGGDVEKCSYDGMNSSNQNYLNDVAGTPGATLTTRRSLRYATCFDKIGMTSAPPVRKASRCEPARSHASIICSQYS